jgi:hypothetical protein
VHLEGKHVTSNKEKGKRFLALLKKREKLEGTKIYYMLYHLATSLYIVGRNYQELSSAISGYEKDLSIWDVKNRAQLDAFLREFRRLMQNYLSSIYSLIEHTQTFRRDLNRYELNRDYSLKLKVLLRNNCVGFVRDLRTYSQHIRLPFIEASLSFDSRKTGAEKLKQRILLEKKELVKWKYWHKVSKKYISSHKEIDLKVVLSEYQGLIKGFYEWFYKTVGGLYSRELREFAKLESELASLS